MQQKVGEGMNLLSSELPVGAANPMQNCRVLSWVGCRAFFFREVVV